MKTQTRHLWWRFSAANLAMGGFLAILLCVLPSQTRAQIAVQEWVQRYNGPGNDIDEAQALIVDGHGDVLVTGYSTGSGSAFDYTTIKYSSAGVPLWTNRYNGPANGPDVATGVAVDRNNDVIVTGYSAGTSPSRPLFVDNYATIKYSNTGVPLWTNRYRGPGDYDHAAALVVDGGNNVIVTGSSSDTDFPFFRFVYATVKYSSAGVPLWTNRYSLTGFGDSANAVAVDSSDNVIVAGSSINATWYSDYVTIKYSSEGIPLWTNRYNGPAIGDDVANALAVDGSNNVIVTGSSYSSVSHTNSDYLTIKYSSEGVPLWTNRYDGPVSSNDFVRTVVVDASGNVIVTGESHNGTNRDYLTIKYSSAGVPVWTNRYDEPAGSDDVAYDAAVDGKGNVVVTGFSELIGHYADYATIEYSSEGVPLWTHRYNGPVNINDFAYAVAVDGSGDVFVTGYSWGSESQHDYATIKYSILRLIPLVIQKLDSHLVLSWTNAAFGLQCATTVNGPFTNIIGATSPCTNSITGAQQYYRLISN